jgi:outer membrane protein
VFHFFVFIFWEFEMKKFLSAALLATAASFAVASAALETVVFDAGKLLQESKEGKIFAESINKKIGVFQGFAKTSYEKISAMQKEVDTKAKALSKEALQTKVETIGQMKKDLDRTLADKKESLEKEIEREKARLGQKFMTTARGLFDKEGWGMIFERNMPGLICVSDGKDVTDKLISAVDTDFEKNKATKPALAKTLTAKNVVKSSDKKVANA